MSGRVDQPEDGDERDLALGWLAFHRGALEAKCSGLTDAQLVARSADPSVLSLLGLVRHMAEMERAYGSWPLGSDDDFVWVWGDYTDGTEDDIDCVADDVAESPCRWREERAATDERLAAVPDMATPSRVNGRSLRWNLAKLVHEYARHNSHADLIRERIDGQTGD